MNAGVDEVEYENPDMPGVFSGLKKFNAVAVSHEYDFIPSLQERLSLAARCLSRGARSIVDKVRSLEVMVDSAGFDELAEQWAAIHTHGPLTPEARTSAIHILNETFTQRSRRLVSAVAAAKAQIALRTAEGEGLNLEHYSDPLLAYDVARLDELRADKQVVVAALEILQSRTWLDHARDLLPGIEQIQVLVTTAAVGKVEADVVTAAIERITQYLGFIDSGYRMFSLIEARNKITDKLADLSMRKSRDKSDRRVLKERAEKIRRHAELVEARAYWVDNMKRIANGLTVFSTRVNAAIDANEHSMVQASAELAGFLRFLRHISR